MKSTSNDTGIGEVTRLIEQLEELKTSLAHNEAKARSRALDLSRQPTATLTTPADRAMEIIFTPFISSSVQTAVRMGLFDALAHHQGQNITTKELATACVAQELLVGRTLRLLASLAFVSEVSHDTWTANETSCVMASPAIAAGHRFVWDIQVEGTYKAPHYLEETDFCCPEEPANGFIQYAHRTKLNVFDYMAKVRPDRLKDFHLFMGNTMGSSNYWVDWYPVQEQILAGYDRSSPLLVDVGGGKGHDIRAFADKFPVLPGQLILQDIAPALATIDSSQRDDRILYEPQDFFTPNITPGARVYFLHHILHDWSEKYALRILSHLRAAMKPGYSKLLIHDLVLPDSGASKYLAAWDAVMMTFNSGIERSEMQWKLLLEKAGFRVEGTWFGEGGREADGIVQAVVDDEGRDYGSLGGVGIGESLAGKLGDLELLKEVVDISCVEVLDEEV